MSSIRLLIAVALLVSPVIASAATTLVDGSFEAKGASVSDYCYDGPGGCPASPWVGGGVIKSGSAAWGGTIAADGQAYGFIQGTSSLSQSFVASSTTQRGVTWFDANRTNTGGLQSYVVSITHGATTIDLGSFTSAASPFVARSSVPFLIVAGETYTLSFTGQTPYVGTSDSDRTSFIDAVALTAVPEPGTWAMLLAGFGLVGLAARRRRVAVAA